MNTPRTHSPLWASHKAGVCMLAAGLIWAGACAPSRLAQDETSENDEDKIVRVYIWSDYISPDVVKRFEKETGIRVEINTFDTQDEKIGRVWSAYAPYDVVVAEDAVVDLLCDLGLLQCLDRRKIPNIINIALPFRRDTSDPNPLYAIPYHWGTTLLAYRGDRTGALPPTWKVLWDARFQGRIWVLRDVRELIGLAAIYAGIRRPGRDPNALKRISDLVREQSRLVACYADTLSIAEALVTGECDVGVLYSGDAVRAAARNTNIVYVIPEEGAPIWVDNLCLLRDAPHPQSAHQFINFLLDGSVAAANANYVRFATPNTAARSEVDPLLLNNLQVYLTEELFKRCVFYEKPDAAMLQCESSLRAELSRLPAWNRGNSHWKPAALDAEMEVLP